jgi:hypothetical protein
VVHTLENLFVLYNPQVCQFRKIIANRIRETDKKKDVQSPFLKRKIKIDGVLG